MNAAVSHFSIAELTFSQIATRKGLPNVPNQAQLENLLRLRSTLLEPARALLGVPLHVDSGFRAPAVNAAVGGAPDSAHTDGRAADVLPIGCPLQQAFDHLRLSDLPYDQIIFECDAWIHMAIARVGVSPRRQMLKATGGPGNWRYELIK